jgi:hypothetical protein
MSDPGLQARHTGGGYETSDADFRQVMLTALGLFGLLIFGLLVSWGSYRFFFERSEDPGTFPATFTTPERFPPAPTVQQNPHKELVVMHAAEDSVLHSYGWVRKKDGIVRVPIDRAMELLVQKGLPARTKP